jgi:lycopene beta-cyclase
MSDYDYIITGAGCAGLSLLVNMIHSGETGDKKILLVDRAPKTQNDRTWCFWEKGEGLFEEIVCRQWDKLWFHSNDYSSLKNIHPYRYKMIRGADFYHYCFRLIGRHAGIDIRYGKVERLESNAGGTFVIVDGEKITARYVFNSILPGMLKPSSVKSSGPAVISSGAAGDPGFTQAAPPRGRWNLLQHFKGWVIETPRPTFHPEEAILMDFRVSQQGGAGFAYMMPFSSTSALVEFTLFSEKLSEQQDYEDGLKDYIRSRLQIEEYRISGQEFGVIPMTSYSFPTREHNILYIGTAGGQTRSSSGYTFQFIQKQSFAIVQALKDTGLPFAPSQGRRFRFYDSILLNVLSTGKLRGDELFIHLFKRNKITDIFSFLDKESKFRQDWHIIRSLPTLPFLQAACQEIF